MASQLRTVIVAFGLALVFGAGGPARAATATISAATAPEGYTRIEFAFDRAPDTQARLANGVLVVSFSEPVEITSQELARGLGSLISGVRKDPDGTGFRMSLTKPVRLVTSAAGERFFVDLLPVDWAGLPPPLPADLIAALTREAREARQLKVEEARLRARPEATLTVEGATHPTFRRLIFNLGGDAPVDYRRTGPAVAVMIGAPYAFDAAAARARLPLEFAGLQARRTENGMTIMVPAPGTGAVRGFREDGDFILDIDREDAPAVIDREDAPAVDAQAGHDDASADAPAAHLQEQAPAASNADAKPVAAKNDPKPAVKALGASPPPARGPPVNASAAAHGKSAAPVGGSPAVAVTPVAPEPAAAASSPDRPSTPSIRQVGQTLRLVFPFSRQVPAAVFQRGKTLWVAFDDPASLKLDDLVAGSGGAIVSAEPVSVDHGQGARFKLAEARLVSVATEGQDWIVSLGEDVMNRSGAIEFAPASDRDGRPAIQAELAGLGTVRQIRDPDVGDQLVIVTLAPPTRGLPATRSFVEFSALPSAQGLALSIQSQDVAVTPAIERIAIERDGGLTLSPSLSVAGAEQTHDGELVLGAADWAVENAKPFAVRETELMRGAALSSLEDRPSARLALAKFYQARGQAADSVAVLGAIIEDAGLSERDPRIAILRASAEVELGRPATALAILSAPTLRLQPEAALWRAAAEEAAGRLEPARAALKEGAGAIASLPADLKARFVALGARLALEAGDAERAEALYHQLEILPATEGVGAREILRARLEDTLGHPGKAVAAYAALARNGDPASAAEAELRAVMIGLRDKSLPQPEALVRLERLVTGWRGDHIEAEGLAKLIELYGDAGRWREAFSTLRVAVEAFPDAEDTRALQDRMQEQFTALFLGDGLDKMPKLDALALFYDFKELLPGGKRGDELVRRLADKLVEVDLLDQAAELLNYQIDNRLTGAARAQVAARVALVDLMNGKPAKAIEALRKTRQADLPATLMKTRMRLEARALAETGRIDLAIEIADGLEGPESKRLKSDILWSARRWPDAGEALEATLGSAWRGPAPLDAGQRADVMRAAIASALAGDGLAVDRIRQKYAPKMADGPEAAGFEIVTAPIEARGDAFREIARSVAASSSFQSFLDEYRKGASQPVGQSASNGGQPKA